MTMIYIILIIKKNRGEMVIFFIQNAFLSFKYVLFDKHQFDFMD